MEDKQRGLAGESSDSWRRRDTEKRRHAVQERAERLERQRQRIADRLEDLERRMTERRR
jgi:hypothetical protein